MKKHEVRTGGGALAQEFRKVADAAPTCVVSARVSHAERALLRKQAAGLSISDYIRARLFDAAAAKLKTRGKFPVKDHKALGRVLGALGRSGLAEDFNTLQTALEDRMLLVDPDTSFAIRRACADVAAMRDDLLKALGLKAEPP